MELNRRPYAWKGQMLTNELHHLCNYDSTTTRYHFDLEVLTQIGEKLMKGYTIFKVYV